MISTYLISLLVIPTVAFTGSSSMTSAYYSLAASTTGTTVLAATAAASSPSSSGTETSIGQHLFEPKERDEYYKQNIAQYLIDLHDTKSCFDFCGGMMFQLVLTEKLRDHLVKLSESDQPQPVIYDSSKSRMHNIPNYSKDATADNIHIFHGREIRQVPWSSGGMGMVLQLSLSSIGVDDDNINSDVEGWTGEEINEYDGWGHDSSRRWRDGNVLEGEGFNDFKKQYGTDAFTLHHRFYLHYDHTGSMWLAAEDGCEGTPKPLLIPPTPPSTEL